MVDFGSNLKELRLKYKMTQKELADKIGVTKSVVSYYELQERSPSPEILIKLSGIFHVTTDYLLGIEHKHAIDVSNLSSDELAVIEQMIKVLENKNKETAQFKTAPFLYIILFCMYLSLNAVLDFGGGESVLHKHGNCHGAYSAGNGSDERALGGNAFKINIAAKLSVFIPVHADIDNNRTGLNHIGGYEFCLADRCHKNIRAFGYIRQILSFGMCNFNRCIFMKQQHSHGLANNITSADNNRFFADGIYTCRMDKFHYSGRSAGQK